MIGRVHKIVSFNVHNSTFLHCGNKNFTRSDRLHDIKFPRCFLRICSFLVNNAEKCHQMKTYSVLQNKVSFLCREKNLLQLFKCGMSKIPINLKQHSVQVVKMCVRQCEFVIAHRVRRGQQICSLYSKMWDEAALRNLLSRIRKQFSRRGRELLLSVAGVCTFNWEKMKIKNPEMDSYVGDIQKVYRLREMTVTCAECRLRVVFDTQISGIEYCNCSVPRVMCSGDCQEWVPFLERKDMLVWRKEDPDTRGLYAYKVYASYDDVAAYDFLCVQLDTEYRKEWDRTAEELTILDSDPSSNSDIIYWVMKWPRMFSNRDYVFNRRFRIDDRNKVMIVVNKCIEHPKCPARPENVRVKDYWSSMVIRPHNEFNKPGIEFCLTYYDDPGVSIPSAITSWVAVSGLPDFMMRLRDAARQLALRRRVCKYNWIPKPEPVPVLQSTPDTDTDFTSAPTVVPTSTSNLPPDPSPKVSLTSTQFTHQEQDSSLQLNTARLFL